MKKLLALILAASLALLAGCGSVTYFEDKVPEKTAIRVGLAEDPATLDPACAASPNDLSLVSHLFEGLTAKNAEGEVVPAAAEGWELTRTKDAAKRPVYTFTIRKDACWSDGTPLKAEDFVYAWTRVISGEAECPYAYLFDVILGADSYDSQKPDRMGLEAAENGKLVITLEGDCAYFPVLLSLPAFFPVREDVVSQNAEGWFLDPAALMGNGAYTLTEWVRDDHMTLTKNERFHASQEIKGNTLKFVIRSGEELLKAASDGTLQAALAPVPGGKTTEWEDGSVYYFALNHAKIKDEAVRRALSLSLDREAVLVAAGGEGITAALRAKDRFFAGEPLAAYDLEAAKAALAEGEDVPKSLTLLTCILTEEENDVNVRIAKAAAEQWEAVLGIEVKVLAKPYDEFLKLREEGNYDIVRAGMVMDFDDPAAVLELFEGRSAANFPNYLSEEYDQLLEKSRSEEPGKERDELLQKAEELLLKEDVAAIVLGGGMTTLYSHETLQGVTANSLGIWSFAGAYYAAPNA